MPAQCQPGTAFRQVALAYRYVVGYSSSPGESPIVSVCVTGDPKKAPASGAAVPVCVYQSPATDAAKYPYDGCTEKDKLDCYSPPIKVDADCPTCAAAAGQRRRFVAIKFNNNARNLQVRRGH